jgi:hypothetical protein
MGVVVAAVVMVTTATYQGLHRKIITEGVPRRITLITISETFFQFVVFVHSRI